MVTMLSTELDAAFRCPLASSVTPAGMFTVTVPSPVAITVTVYSVLVTCFSSTFEMGAVPVTCTSLAVNPVTALLNDAKNTMFSPVLGSS